MNLSENPVAQVSVTRECSGASPATEFRMSWKRAGSRSEMDIMKEDIHPNYVETAVSCGCGNKFTTRSTKPKISVEICSACHPFFTASKSSSTPPGGSRSSSGSTSGARRTNPPLAKRRLKADSYSPDNRNLRDCRIVRQSSFWRVHRADEFCRGRCRSLADSHFRGRHVSPVFRQSSSATTSWNVSCKTRRSSLTRGSWSRYSANTVVWPKSPCEFGNSTAWLTRSPRRK